MDHVPICPLPSLPEGTGARFGDVQTLEEPSHPPSIIYPRTKMITIWLFNIAMENHHF